MEENQETNENVERLENSMQSDENTKEEVVKKKIKQWPFVVAAAIFVGFIAAICVAMAFTTS